METSNHLTGDPHGPVVQAGVVHGDVIQIVNVGESHGPNDASVNPGWSFSGRSPDPRAAPWDFFWRPWEEPETYRLSIRNKLPVPLVIAEAGFVLRRAPRETGVDLARITAPEVEFPLTVRGHASREVPSTALASFSRYQAGKESEQFWLGAYAVTARGREYRGYNHYPGSRRVRGTRFEQEYLKRRARGERVSL
ncbi:hypothetical protein [Nocardiopsis dassonvillei]|uniref:hypothetical protein n=1 Tax=Nocardiopsis dassonvillei TaxID=2014 RepID=UPI0012FE37C2|nr:hypothetical protein [Nocardiopsis dassonvillei]